MRADAGHRQRIGHVARHLDDLLERDGVERLDRAVGVDRLVEDNRLRRRVACDGVRVAAWFPRSKGEPMLT